jgi:hypothetical protein
MMREEDSSFDSDSAMTECSVDPVQDEEPNTAPPANLGQGEEPSVVFNNDWLRNDDRHT